MILAVYLIGFACFVFGVVELIHAIRRWIRFNLDLAYQRGRRDALKSWKSALDERDAKRVENAERWTDPEAGEPACIDWATIDANRKAEKDAKRGGGAAA